MESCQTRPAKRIVEVLIKELKSSVRVGNSNRGDQTKRVSERAVENDKEIHRRLSTRTNLERMQKVCFRNKLNKVAPWRPKIVNRGLKKNPEEVLG